MGPINIDQQHWILFLINMKLRTATYIDPLQCSPFESKAKKACRKVTKNINKWLGNIQIKYERIKRHIQNNSYDCGPFICGYAENIAKGNSIESINIEQIRKTCREASNKATNPKDRKTITGGCNTISAPPTEAILYFSEDAMMEIITRELKNNRNFIIPPAMTRAIIKKDKETIMNHLEFRSFRGKENIIIPTIVNNHWSLFVIKTNDLSIQQTICHDNNGEDHDANQEALQRIAKTMEFFLWTEEELTRKPCILTEANPRDSGAEIAKQIIRLLYNNSNLIYNLGDIKEKAKKLLYRKIREQKRGLRTTMKRSTRNSLNIHTARTRRALADQLIADTKEQDVNTKVGEFEKLIGNIRPIHNKPSLYMGSLTQATRIDHGSIRRIYKLSKKTAYQLIVNRNTIDGHPDIKLLENHYEDKQNGRGRGISEMTRQAIKRGPPFVFEVPSTEELQAVMKKKCLDNTAPGKNNITYRDIKFTDPDLKIMHNIIENCIVNKTIPKNWRSYKTTMLPKPGKDGNYADKGSWRPIALLDCMYKIYTTVLYKQLNAWINENELLHPMQKSLGSDNGCAEHNFIIKAAANKTKEQLKQTLHICFLDIEEAFPSIDMDQILTILEVMGVQKAAIETIKDIYNQCTTTISCNNNSSKSIGIHRGVRQGCPLSMLLFNIGINPLLNRFDTTLEGGIIINNHRISTLAYADDLVIMAQNRYGLQCLLKHAEDFAQEMGFKFKPGKCGHLQIGKKRTLRELQIGNENIPEIPISDSYKYLGVEINNNMHAVPEETFRKIINDIENCTASALAPWQKLDAYRTFILPKFIYLFNNNHLYLKEVYRWDEIIRSKLKILIGLPTHAGNAYLYTSQKDGGCGQSSLTDEYLILTIVQAYNMLTSADPTTKDAAWYTIRMGAKGNNFVYDNNMDEAIEWLNKGDRAGRMVSWWTQTRVAIYLLQTKFQIKVEFNITGNNIGIEITSPEENDNRAIGRVTEKERDKLGKYIRTKIRLCYKLKWYNQAYGNTARTFNMGKLCTKPIFDGSLTTAEYYFINRTRNNKLQVHTSHGFNSDKSCRLCRYPEETQAHVFVHCEYTDGFINERHDNIIRIVEEEILAELQVSTKNNKECEVAPSKKRVDLQIINHASKKYSLIDIKCPYDEITNINDANKRNIEKYTELQNEVKRALPEWNVTLGTIVVGCLGSWWNGNNKTLKSIGLSEESIEKIAKDATVAAIQWSYGQWQCHQRRSFNQPSSFIDNNDDEANDEHNNLNTLEVDYEEKA